MRWRRSRRPAEDRRARRRGPAQETLRAAAPGRDPQPARHRSPELARLTAHQGRERRRASIRPPVRGEQKLLYASSLWTRPLRLSMVAWALVVDSRTVPRRRPPAPAAGRLAAVPSMNDLVRQHTALSDSDLEWLHLLVSEWQLLSDLSFADLVLWVPTLDGTRYVSVAQMRPNTGPTSHQDDMVGHLVPARPPPAAGRRARRGPDRARGRPGVARGGARTGRVHPRAPRGPGARRHRAQHQPAHRPHPEPAGADLPPERLRPRPDDRGRAPSPSPASRWTWTTRRASATD